MKKAFPRMLACGAFVCGVFGGTPTMLHAAPVYRELSDSRHSIVTGVSGDGRFVVTAMADMRQNLVAGGVQVEVNIHNASDAAVWIWNPLDSLNFAVRRDGADLKLPAFIARQVQDVWGKPSFDLPYYLRGMLLGNQRLGDREREPQELRLRPGETVTLFTTLDRELIIDQTREPADSASIHNLSHGEYEIRAHYGLHIRDGKTSPWDAESLNLPPINVSAFDGRPGV